MPETEGAGSSTGCEPGLLRAALVWNHFQFDCQISRMGYQLAAEGTSFDKGKLVEGDGFPSAGKREDPGNDSDDFLALRHLRD
ncbi:MAG: hypothetical protein KC777_07835 [Cyanobacteria bacterium HKST-UBA02]|nr:hypothetical protein [Cyanobacteria bacterium HKST-UBA02]